jgi:hypothetical protein
MERIIEIGTSFNASKMDINEKSRVHEEKAQVEQHRKPEVGEKTAKKGKLEVKINHNISKGKRQNKEVKNTMQNEDPFSDFSEYETTGNQKEAMNFNEEIEKSKTLEEFAGDWSRQMKQDPIVKTMLRIRNRNWK